MNLEVEIENALKFFSLEENFTEEELKKQYYLLARKYHPDMGEFTSSVLFLELLKYKSILETYHESKQSSEVSESLDDYTIYKAAKKIENLAVLKYFHARDGIQIRLDKSENPQLIHLRKELSQAKKMYETILKEYPKSIWTKDAKESIDRILVWFR